MSSSEEDSTSPDASVDALPGASSSDVLIEVMRGALVESRHRGAIIAVDAAGRVIASAGEARMRTYFRSAAKPFQAIPILTSGAAERYHLTQKELSVINASHSGEPMHLEAVRSILSRAGLSESALQCGAHPPFDEASAESLRARGESLSPIHNNCSGKHAGMLLLARHLGAEVDNYLDPEHPVQRLIRAALAAFAGVDERSIAVAIDGCSAPVFALTLEEMARSYARLVASDETSLDASLREAAASIVRAFINHPEMIGGSTGRLDTDLMREARGALISKVGAEGVQLIGALPSSRYPRGLGVAIKIEDGDSRRARDPVVIETLAQLDLLDRKQIDNLARYARATIRNHRRMEVGEVRPSFTLRRYQ